MNSEAHLTRIFVALAEMEGSLVSRSQAKHVAARFEHFAEVELDFSGVSSVGQGFADELLRVWPLSHESTTLKAVGAEGQVAMMIQHVRARKDLPQAPC